MHRAVLSATGVFVTLVGAVLLIAPEAYVTYFVVDFVPGMEFAARRFSPALLGLGVLLLLAKDVPPGRFLLALHVVTGIAFLLVAATGVHAWSTSLAGTTVLGAAVVECGIATLLLVTARLAGRAK